MKAAVKIPVTVKCRIGIDEQDPEAALDTITRTVVAAGADALIVHARKAWLAGLSPKENRDMPPLDYDRVYRLKRAWPDLDDFDQRRRWKSSRRLRASFACRRRDDGPRGLSGAVAAAECRPRYIRRSHRRSHRRRTRRAHSFRISNVKLRAGTRLHAIARHTLGLFHGMPGARAYRRYLGDRRRQARRECKNVRGGVGACRRAPRSFQSRQSGGRRS